MHWDFVCSITVVCVCVCNNNSSQWWSRVFLYPVRTLVCPVNIKRYYVMCTDCVVGEWGKFGTCSQTCGAGIISRTRSILIAPDAGGERCPNLIDSEPCYHQPCPEGINGINIDLFSQGSFCNLINYMWKFVLSCNNSVYMLILQHTYTCM